MQTLNNRKPLLIKLLAVIFITLLCCNLPNLINLMMFWRLCKEQDRVIPPHTEVLISACQQPIVRGVPGGEVVFIHEERTGKMYLLDLRTGEERDLPKDPLLLDRGVFLSSELVWLEGSLVGPDDPSYRPHYILDLTNGEIYELLDLDLLPRLEDGYFDSKYLIYLQSAQQVFIHHSKNTLIALSPDFRQHTKNSVVFSQYSLEGGADAENGQLLEQLMKELGIDYEIIDPTNTVYAGLLSPTGKYVVRNDGIYLSETNMPIVTSEYTSGRLTGGDFKSWYYDESAVVAQETASYLIYDPFFGPYFRIFTPVLKLNLPIP